MSIRILNSKTLRSLEKPPHLQIYDETNDPYELVKHVDYMLDYDHAQGAVKFNIFSLTLTKFAMAWFKTLLEWSIDAWKELCDAFIAHFIARKWTPIIMVVLNGVLPKWRKPCTSTLHLPKSGRSSWGYWISDSNYKRGR